MMEMPASNCCSSLSRRSTSARVAWSAASLSAVCLCSSFSSLRQYMPTHRCSRYGLSKAIPLTQHRHLGIELQTLGGPCAHNRDKHAA